MTLDEEIAALKRRHKRGERLVKAFEKLTEEEQENATRSIESVAWLRRVAEVGTKIDAKRLLREGRREDEEDSGGVQKDSAGGFGCAGPKPHAPE